MKRLLGPDYRNPDRAPEHRRETRVHYGERRDPPPPPTSSPTGPACSLGSRPPPGSATAAPIFPNTPEGQAQRL